jgi:hypothetical protein
VGRNLANILTIFEKIDEAKSQGVIGNLLREAGNTQCKRSHQNSIIGLVYGEYVVTVVSHS